MLTSDPRSNWFDGETVREAHPLTDRCESRLSDGSGSHVLKSEKWGTSADQGPPRGEVAWGPHGTDFGC